MTAMVKASEMVIAGSGLAPRSFDEAKAQASALAQARGFVPAAFIGNAPAILAALMTGVELGIGPMQALRSVHVIEGKPTLSADLMLGLAIRAGVRVEWLVNTPTEAKARFTRPGFPAHVESFTMKEAEQARLAGKDNWKKHPRAMLRARVVSAALRAWSPDVLGAGAYIAGEIDPDAQPIDAIEAAWSEAASSVEREPHGETTRPAINEDGEEVSAEPRRIEAPKQLTHCDTAEELAAWCRQHGAGVIARGEDAVGKVRSRAAQIGVGDEDALRMLGLKPEAA